MGRVACGARARGAERVVRFAGLGAARNTGSWRRGACTWAMLPGSTPSGAWTGRGGTRCVPRAAGRVPPERLVCRTRGQEARCVRAVRSCGADVRRVLPRTGPVRRAAADRVACGARTAETCGAAWRVALDRAVCCTGRLAPGHVASRRVGRDAGVGATMRITCCLVRALNLRSCVRMLLRRVRCVLAQEDYGSRSVGRQDALQRGGLVLARGAVWALCIVPGEVGVV